MAFTDNSDIYIAVDEEGINRVVRHIMRQRPSLFNYGTAWVEEKLEERLCEPIDPAPAVRERENPLIDVRDPLEVLGTNYGLDFCVQIIRAQIDFHPGNVVTLPPELNPPLEEQHLAIHGRVCGGLGCPRKEELDEIQPPDPQQDEERDTIVLHPEELKCFCIDLFALGHFELTGPAESQQLLGKVDGVEIVDIKPEGLENSLECYLHVLIHLVVLPTVSAAVEEAVLKILDDLNKQASVTLSFASTSTAIPHNPAIEDDQLKLFIDVKVEEESP